MSIIRGPRPETNWYNLDKRISEDERLSWGARGLLIFLLGKPDHWEVSVRHLINQTKDALGKSSGRDAVRVILKELERAGYLTADIARSEGGAFNGMAYTVCEIPQESPQTGFPATAKPATAKPATENHPLVKTERKQPTDSKQKTEIKITADAGASLGAGSLVVSHPQEACKPDGRPADMPGPSDPKCKTYKTWGYYAYRYMQVYGVYPVWNASVGGMMAKLIDALGAEEAPSVAAYYVRAQKKSYVESMHSVKLLLADCTALRTQWITNTSMTSAKAAQADKTQTNFDAASDAQALLRQRRQDREQSNANE